VPLRNCVQYRRVKNICQLLFLSEIISDAHLGYPLNICYRTGDGTVQTLAAALAAAPAAEADEKLRTRPAGRM